MSLFFVEPEAVEHNVVTVKGGDVNHIKNVLRMNRGDSLTVSDSTGRFYECRIDRFDDNVLIAEILSISESDTEPKIPCTLYQGIPKGDKMELIIQKCVELGITRIVPVIMERTVVRFGNEKDKLRKTERWNKISMEASKQSGRAIVPEITVPVSLKEAIADADNAEFKFVPFENERHTTLKSILRNNANAKSIAYLIGPEGGISLPELEAVNDAGFSSVTLGKRILRTETAGIAVLSAVRYELGD